jgi:hypothetical protein
MFIWIWKAIMWPIHAIYYLIINPPCDVCGYQGCGACDEVEHGD